MITFKFNKLGLSYNTYMWQPDVTVLEIEIPSNGLFQIDQLKPANGIDSFENCFIDWGDDGYYQELRPYQRVDNLIPIVGPISGAEMRHTYKFNNNNGNRKNRTIVKIIGDIGSFKLPIKCVTTLYQLSDKLTDCSEMFKDQKILTVINTDARIPKNVINTYDMFKGCTNLLAIPDYFFYNWSLPSTLIESEDGSSDTIQSDIIFDQLIGGFTANPDDLEKLYLKNIKLTNLQNISGMFENCTSLQYLHNAFVLPDSVTNLNNMFKGCISLRKLGDDLEIPESISSNLVNFCSGCVSLQYIPSTLSFENISGSVESCFQNCSGLQIIPTGFKLHPDTINTTNLFKNCYNITDIPKDLLSNNAFTKLQTAESMFQNCYKLSGLSESFNIPSTCINLNKTFYSCSSIVELPSNFSLSDTTSDISLKSTFENCTSLTGIPENFNFPSAVNNLEEFFKNCTSLTYLNQNLTLPNVDSMKSLFQNCNSLTVCPDSVNLKNCIVSNISCVFKNCTSLTYLAKDFQFPNMITESYQTFENCYNLNLIIQNVIRFWIFKSL